MRIAIYGAGNGGKLWAEIAEECGHEVACFIDDFKEGCVKLDEYNGGYPIAPAIFDNNVRLSVLNKHRLIRLVHRKAHIFRSAEIGIGTLIKPFVMVGARTKVGRCCILDSNVTIEHDTNIEDGVFISVGSNIGSSVSIGEKTLIGIGCNIQTGVKIGKNCTICSGVTVLNDVSDNAIIKKLL